MGDANQFGFGRGRIQNGVQRNGPFDFARNVGKSHPCARVCVCCVVALNRFPPGHVNGTHLNHTIVVVVALELDSISLENIEDQLLTDVAVPVERGQSLLEVFIDLIHKQIRNGINRVNALDFTQWENHVLSESIIHKVLQK